MACNFSPVACVLFMFIEWVLWAEMILWQGKTHKKWKLRASQHLQQSTSNLQEEALFEKQNPPTLNTNVLPTARLPVEKDATHYNMSHRRRGKAYIFNHMHFDPVQQLVDRKGTNVDRDSLRVCLRQLDFEVEVFNDLPVKDIERELEQAALEDHSDADCVLVAGAVINTIKITHFNWKLEN